MIDWLVVVYPPTANNVTSIFGATFKSNKDTTSNKKEERTNERTNEVNNSDTFNFRPGCQFYAYFTTR